MLFMDLMYATVISYLTCLAKILQTIYFAKGFITTSVYLDLVFLRLKLLKVDLNRLHIDCEIIE